MEDNKIERLMLHVKRVSDALKVYEETGSLGEMHDVIFLEDADRADKAWSHLARVFEHLLKLQFSTLSSESFIRETWVRQTQDHLDKFQELLRTRKFQLDKNVYREIESSFQDAYTQGIRFYQKAMKEHDNLTTNFKSIPETPPWALDTLIDDMLLISEILERTCPSKKILTIPIN